MNLKCAGRLSGLKMTTTTIKETNNLKKIYIYTSAELVERCRNFRKIIVVK